MCDNRLQCLSVFDLEPNRACHFISEDAQDESLSLNSGENDDVNLNVSSDLVFDQHEADSEDLTSPEELVVFLLNRLFRRCLRRASCRRATTALDS